MTNDESSMSPNNTDSSQQHYRLQLLAQAIEKVENESLQKKISVPTSPISPNRQQQQTQVPLDSLSMTTQQQQQQQQELIMKLLAQQNVAAVMAAAAAAAQLQIHQQKKHEPISPPSTSSASSTSESPIDFSSHRSLDDNNDCSTPSSPISNQHQLISTMLQNLQSSPTTPSTFPLLLTNKNGKPTRPFKAYPREPLMLPLGFCPTAAPTADQTNILLEAATRTTSNRKRLAQTQERLKQRLQQQQQQQQQQTQPYFISSSGAQILQPPKKRHRTMESTNSNEENTTITPSTENNNTNSSSTTTTEPSPNDELNNSIKDDAYWERRRKNNEAAKRSRDARRAKEDEIAIRY